MNRIYEITGLRDPFADDFLKVRESMDLEQRRQEFKTRLDERGSSLRLLEMVADINRETFVKQAHGQMSGQEYTAVMEGAFRKYYPEQFDGNSGITWIHSLNLKMRCDDYYKPRLI
jgi:hypothetical protein